MGKASKDKGYRGENNLRHLLQDAGIDCERIPLSGASAITPSCDLLIGDDQAEVKVRANGFTTFYKWLAGNEYLFVKADRRPYLAVMEIKTLIQLLKRGANSHAEL